MNDQLTFGYEISIIDVVFGHRVRYSQREGGAPSHDFTIDCLDIGKRRPVMIPRQTVTTSHAVNLFLSLFADFWVHDSSVDKSSDDTGNLERDYEESTEMSGL